VREDDIVVKLRVSTVADSASSIYDTMTKAADEIEILRSVGDQLFSKLLEVYKDTEVPEDVAALISSWEEVRGG
jgi:hypothetical protein